MFDDYIPHDRHLRANLRLATIAISAQAELNRNLVDNIEVKDKTTDFFKEKYLQERQKNDDLSQKYLDEQQKNDDLNQEIFELRGKVKILENKVRECECRADAWDNDGSSYADCRDRDYAADRLGIG